jgi:hypothetical protein
MADQRFFNAFLTPASTTVCGRKLKPFCLKHRLFMEGIESPFLKEDVEITAQDIIIALKICADEAIGRPTLADICLGVRLSLSKDYKRRAALAIVRHLSTQANFPQFWERTDRKTYGSSSVPWQLTIVANLVRNGVGYAEALTMPEAKAVWLSAVFSIQAGAKLEFLTTDDEALIDEMAKLGAQENNGQ